MFWREALCQVERIPPMARLLTVSSETRSRWVQAREAGGKSVTTRRRRGLARVAHKTMSILYAVQLMLALRLAPSPVESAVMLQPHPEDSESQLVADLMVAGVPAGGCT